MAWLDYKKAYGIVPSSRISECLEMFGIANNVRDLEKDFSMQQLIPIVCFVYGCIDIGVERSKGWLCMGQ